jgi:outer membrane protein OmpA-like peptidoglycan-associated protein
MPSRVSPSLVLISISCGLVAARAAADEAVPAGGQPLDVPSPVQVAPSPTAAAPVAALAPAAAPRSESTDDWSVRDRLLAEAPALSGLPGTYRATDALPGAPGQFRLGIFADGYSASFLCTADQPCPSATGGAKQTDSTTGHFGTSFTLSLGLAQLGSGTLEAYARTSATATSDTTGKPQLLQALGDSSLGLKYGARVTPGVGVGFLGGIDVVNGAGSVGLDGAATGGHLAFLSTFDARELAKPAPVRVLFNAGYTFDNRGAVVEGTEATRGVPVSRFERLGLGAARTDHMDFAIALEGLFADERFRPFLEGSLTALVNRQGYKCLRTNPSGDKCLADSMLVPARLTIGFRGQPLGTKAFSLLAAADVALSGASGFIEEALPIPPWSVGVGASWTFDTRERPPVVQIKEVEKAVATGPAGTRVLGRSIDAVGGKPVGFTRVHVVGHESEPGLIAGVDGAFRTDPVEAGQLELLLEAEGYKPARCAITFPVMAAGQAPALEVAADCPVEPLPAILAVEGTVRDMENGAPMADVAVHVKDATGKTLTATSNATGAYRVEGVMAGAFKVDAEPEGYLFTGIAATGKARTEKTVDVYLRAKPKQTLVTLSKNEIAIKQQIQFGVDTAKILPESFALLAEIADVIARTPSIKRLEVQGHTDNAGAPDYNQKLSDGRAASVRQWLIEHGIESNRLIATGYGESKPLVPNLTPMMKAKNRRVQFIIVDGPQGP